MYIIRAQMYNITGIRSLCGSPASVKVSQMVHRVIGLLEFCLWQSQFFFHSDSIFTKKICYWVVSTMLFIKIEDTIFLFLVILDGSKTRPLTGLVLFVIAWSLVMGGGVRVCWHSVSACSLDEVWAITRLRDGATLSKKTSECTLQSASAIHACPKRIVM